MENRVFNATLIFFSENLLWDVEMNVNIFKSITGNGNEEVVANG